MVLSANWTVQNGSFERKHCNVIQNFFQIPVTCKTESVENAGVAFVKGADERNEFIGKKTQTNSNI